jgi:hypothetical protein
MSVACTSAQRVIYWHYCLSKEAVGLCHKLICAVDIIRKDKYIHVMKEHHIQLRLGTREEDI